MNLNRYLFRRCRVQLNPAPTEQVPIKVHLNPAPTEQVPIIPITCPFCPGAAVCVLLPREIISARVDVLRCRSCGLVFLESHGGKDAEDPSEKAYWDNEEMKKMYLDENIHDVFRREFEARLGMIESLYPWTGKLLDVGCGVGHFMSSARRRGWDVKGLDISHAAARAAKEAYHHEVAVGTLENINLPDGEFDVITLWDVIEHIRRPIENIQAANRMLRQGGLLVMKTPNEESLFKWLAREAYRLFGERGSLLAKYVYYVPHYFSYSARTITRLLNQSGFEVLEIQQDETPEEFAENKIHVHYKKDPMRNLVILFLPVVRLLARLIGRRNKMVVYARKG